MNTLKILIKDGETPAQAFRRAVDCVGQVPAVRDCRDEIVSDLLVALAGEPLTPNAAHDLVNRRGRFYDSLVTQGEKRRRDEAGIAAFRE